MSEFEEFVNFVTAERMKNVEFISMKDFSSFNEIEIKSDEEKKCRFCNRKESDGVTFKNKAHIVPEFLGNNVYFTSNECDECNSNLSEFEQNLKKFLSPDLYHTSIRNTKKNKSIYINRKNIKAGVIENLKNNDHMQKFISEIEEMETCKIDNQNKIIKEIFNTHKFVPYDAFLGFCKIALLMTSESELKHMEYIRRILLKKEIFAKEIVIRKIFLNSNSLLKGEKVFLFKGKECYILVMSIRNYFYEIFIPVSKVSSAIAYKSQDAPFPFNFKNSEDEMFVVLTGKEVVGEVEREMFSKFESWKEYSEFSEDENIDFYKMTEQIYPNSEKLLENLRKRLNLKN